MFVVSIGRLLVSLARQSVDGHVDAQHPALGGHDLLLEAGVLPSARGA